MPANALLKWRTSSVPTVAVVALYWLTVTQPSWALPVLRATVPPTTLDTASEPDTYAVPLIESTCSGAEFPMPRRPLVSSRIFSLEFWYHTNEAADGTVRSSLLADTPRPYASDPFSARMSFGFCPATLLYVPPKLSRTTFPVPWYTRLPSCRCLVGANVAIPTLPLKVAVLCVVTAPFALSVPPTLTSVGSRGFEN